MSVSQVNIGEYVGLSTDLKPLNVSEGSTFIELDTTERYIFSGLTWGLITSKDIISAYYFGVIGDGTTDDTQAIEDALNSNYSTVYFHPGTYMITDKIAVNSGNVIKVIGGENVVFSVVLSSPPSHVFAIYKNIQFENIIFDFNGGSVIKGLYYANNCGMIRLRNLKFRNLKDMNNSYSSSIVTVSGLGNNVDIDGIEFNNLLKLNSTVIGQYGGGLICFIYSDEGDTSKSALNGTIRNVKIIETHNISSDGNISFFNVSGVHVVNYDYTGTDGNVLIENVYGYNFGKRLIKGDTRNLTINNVYGYSNANDTLGCIGLSNSGSTQQNISISNLQAYGNMNYGVSSSCTDTVINNAIINIQNSVRTLYNSELNISSYPILVNANRTSISNCVLSGEKCITWGNRNVQDLKVSNTTLIVPSWGVRAVNPPSGSNNGFKNFEFNNVTIISNLNTDSSTVFMETKGILTGKQGSIGNGLKLINCTMYTTAMNAYFMYLDYVNDIDIVNLTLNNDGTAAHRAYRGILAEYCKNIRISNIDCSANINTVVEVRYSDNSSINELYAPLCKYNFMTSDSNNINLSNLDVSKMYTGDKTQLKNVFIDNIHIYSTSSYRSLVNYQGQMGYDTSISKPIWCKIPATKEVDILTVSSGAASSGNVTITLYDGTTPIATTIAVTAVQTAIEICDQIRQTIFKHWIPGGACGSASVIFTKTTGGTNTAPFIDNGSTGVTATFAVTTAGTAPVWVDAIGTTV